MPGFELDGLVCVGAIAGAFGVTGEARVKSFCAEPRAIGDYGPLATEDGRRFTLRISCSAGRSSTVDGCSRKQRRTTAATVWARRRSGTSFPDL